MTLRHRMIRAFEQAGVRRAAEEGAAIPLKGAAIQCESLHRATLICDVVQDTELMLRNARLMVFVLGVAGWDEAAADKWVARELIAAKNQARESVKREGALTITLTVDHPPRLIMLKVEEQA